MAHPTIPIGVEPVKDGTPAERSQYWRVVDRDAAAAFSALRDTGTSCIRFGSMASDVMRALDERCEAHGIETKIAKRSDIGLDYYRADAWAAIAERTGQPRSHTNVDFLWDVMRSLRDRIAA